jgi:multidrug efflux system outer membrane protein
MCTTRSLQSPIPWIAITALLSQACSVHTPDLSPAPPMLGIVAQDRPATTGKWWATFGDAALNGIVEEALAENPGVRAIGLRIVQAQARQRQVGAGLFPRLSGDADAGMDWDEDRKQAETSSAGLLLDWEFDAWGRIRASRAAKTKEVEATEEDRQAARLLLSAVVVDSWFRLAEARGQLELANKQAELAKTLLELTKLRAGQGQGSAVAVLQQQEQLQSIQTRVPRIQARIRALELSLDALAGKLPGKPEGMAGAELPELSPVPKYGMPSSLLADRPDLRAIRARVVALDFEIGEAIADRFPRFLVGGSLTGTGTPGIDTFIQDAVAAVVGPIFDAGSRKAEVERRRARLQEGMELYAEAFLSAARDTETAISNEKLLAEKVRLQGEQLNAARDLLAETRNRYVQGASDYLPVLDAVSKVHQLERDHLAGRRELLQARVAMHRALGGPMPDGN